jgi:hypothetical protein
MTQNTKREYLPPQIKQLQVSVEEGYALSSQNIVATGDNDAIHFTTVQGSWE